MHAEVAIREQELLHMCLSLILDLLAMLPAECEQIVAIAAAVLRMAACDSWSALSCTSWDEPTAVADGMMPAEAICL